MKKLISYSWPGNVRELRNIIERSIITSKGGKLEFNLPAYSRKPDHELQNNSIQKSTIEILTDQEIEALSNKNTMNAIKMCDGKIYGKKGAASLLNIPPTTLCSRIKKIKGRE
ncbi:MAG: hypothetical protein KAI40_05595 [Desulfobacterales bacterium]|nr:hypothetical protein [Desulfobacterales bacterium]